MSVVTMGQVCVVTGLLMISRRVMLGRFPVVPSGVLVVLGRLFVM